MSANIGRTADAWWLDTPAGMIRLDLAADTTGGLLSDRSALDDAVAVARARAAENADHVLPAASPQLLRGR